MTEVWRGTLRKMRVRPGDQEGEPAQYALADGHWHPEERVPDRPLNPLIGRPITIEFTGSIACVYCGRATKKSFGEGFCYPCFQARAEADICIVKPELCHYHLPHDPCRDDAFAHRHCFQPHVLYASLTSAPKVGLTRRENIPTRWLDQGATQAIALAELADRRTAGLIEAHLRDQGGLADRTHWTRLLKNAEGEGDLAAFAAQVLAMLADHGTAALPEDQRRSRRFSYPVLEYPEKVKSQSLDRTATVAGTLLGIKGQYLLLDTGVINLRKHAGYEVTVGAEGADEEPGGLELAAELPIDGVLDLHMFQPRETRELVPVYLDLCRERGILSVRIIHGKGVGVQREIVRGILAGHPAVLSYGHPGDGGSWGATVVQLKPLGEEV